MLEYFDRVYIINLAHREDRRREITQQLKNIGATVDREHIRFFDAIKPTSAEGFPTVGTRGCFLSHLAILKEAKASNLGYVLIVEDDCDFVKDFEERSTVHLQVLQMHRPDFFYLGALNTIDSAHVPEGWVDSGAEIMGAHCVAFGGEILESLIAYLEAILGRSPGDPLGGPMHIDGAYSRFRKTSQEITTYIAKPELAYQRFSPTDIHNKSIFHTYWDASFAGHIYRSVKNFFRRHRE